MRYSNYYKWLHWVTQIIVGGYTGYIVAGYMGYSVCYGLHGWSHREYFSKIHGLFTLSQVPQVGRPIWVIIVTGYIGYMGYIVTCFIGYLGYIDTGYLGYILIFHVIWVITKGYTYCYKLHGWLHVVTWLQITWATHLYTGDMGGYMGLLLGASVITLVELLDLILYNNFLRCRGKRRQRRQRGKPNKVQDKTTAQRKQAFIVQQMQTEQSTGQNHSTEEAGFYSAANVDKTKYRTNQLRLTLMSCLATNGKIKSKSNNSEKLVERRI